MEFNLSLGNTGRLTELHEALGMISLKRGKGISCSRPLPQAPQSFLSVLLPNHP